MTMAKMTKVQLRDYDKLLAVLGKARDAIYAFGCDRNVPFYECYSLATQEAQDKHSKAITALIRFESEMVAQGRAWRSTLGIFTPNWR